MKRLACEMCGSIDIIKQDGVFVCQSCGLKYSVEEAKKMMVEGTVEVAGTVKVDTSDKLKNLYQIARRAKDDDNYDDARRYYDMALIEDPTSWEATFYVTYFKARRCKLAELASAAESVNNCIGSACNLVSIYVEKEEDKERAIDEIASRAIELSGLLYLNAKQMLQKDQSRTSERRDINLRYNTGFLDVIEGIANGMSESNANNQAFADIAKPAIMVLYNAGDKFENVFEGKTFIPRIVSALWDAAIAMHTKEITLFKSDTSFNGDFIKKYQNKLQSYKIKLRAKRPKPTASPESILSKYEFSSKANGNVYLKPNIPDKKLRNAITTYAMGTKAEDVFLLLDDTAFGSAKDGLLFSRAGLYLHAAFSEPRFIALSDICEVKTEKRKLFINGDLAFECGTLFRDDSATLGKVVLDLSWNADFAIK